MTHKRTRLPRVRPKNQCKITCRTEKEKTSLCSHAHMVLLNCQGKFMQSSYPTRFGGKQFPVPSVNNNTAIIFLEKRANFDLQNHSKNKMTFLRHFWDLSHFVIMSKRSRKYTSLMKVPFLSHPSLLTLSAADSPHWTHFKNVRLMII